MILPPTKDRDSLLHQLRISCQDLQSVHIDHYTHPPPTRTAPIEGQDKEIIDGYISAVISSPKLKTLNIDLTCFGLHFEGGSRPGDGYHLGPALSKCPPFPYLKELRVCGVKLDQQEFFTFVQDVGHTLRRLYVDVQAPERELGIDTGTSPRPTGGSAAGDSQVGSLYYRFEA